MCVVTHPWKRPLYLNQHVQFNFSLNHMVWLMYGDFCNPTSRQYSFFSPVHKNYSRIDNFFLDKRLFPLVTECDYGSIVISDHALCFSSGEMFTNFIASEIKLFLNINQTLGMFPLPIWESLKTYLHGQIISYCANTNKASATS